MLKEKRIKDYEDYGITTNGDVISYKYSTPRVMSPWKQSGGYSNIGLMKNGVKKNFGIHRLVAEAFIPNPDNLPEVGHIIPISEGGGNNVENLYWTTRKENQNDSFSRHSPVRNFINCILISPTGDIIGEFESIIDNILTDPKGPNLESLYSNGYDGYTSRDGRHINNVVYDSKSNTSLGYRVLNEHRRSHKRAQGNIYQFYIWQSIK